MLTLDIYTSSERIRLAATAEDAHEQLAHKLAEIRSGAECLHLFAPSSRAFVDLHPLDGRESQFGIFFPSPLLNESFLDALARSIEGSSSVPIQRKHLLIMFSTIFSRLRAGY